MIWQVQKHNEDGTRDFLAQIEISSRKDENKLTKILDEVKIKYPGAKIFIHNEDAPEFYWQKVKTIFDDERLFFINTDKED
jgi:hypothetical protein